MKISRLFILLLLLATLNLPKFSVAQKKTQAIGLEIESDPIAFIFNGYSLHTAYTFSSFRASLGVFGIQTPEFFLADDRFSVFSSGYDMKFDYLFNRTGGFFVGTQFVYGRDKIELKDSHERESVWGYSVGLRTGYRFMFGREESGSRGFYIVPWFALMYSPDAKPQHIGAETYAQPKWTPFPTIHLGWRF
ncbi:hypothetical protein SYJ56_25450 [Algoriphagus sp. D3-2-R+10]|uniref:hypothetical protein n=1 Tax=Algoriphagus aurantiacus TaxID=3103948 RepID=UPI002B38473A|nr:hypothetical protein [Algoriphagus sp. D3-2-R+10]MEB2778679.1 hypothetical protein [Algoriphagus sp. D3-2-R+10]